MYLLDREKKNWIEEMKIKRFNTEIINKQAIEKEKFYNDRAIIELVHVCNMNNYSEWNKIIIKLYINLD